MDFLDLHSLDKCKKSDNRQFLLNFATVKFFQRALFFGQRIEQPTIQDVQGFLKCREVE